jgi:flagellin
LYDGATSGDGTEYGVYSGELRGFNSGTSNGTRVIFTSTAEAGKNVSDLTASADPVVLGVSRSTNTLTLSAAGAKLGLEDVSLTVKDVADPGVFTLTANSDTGIAGTSQSVNVGSIAAGASKSLVFDQLGVSFSLTNSRSVEVTNDDFMVSTSKLDTLSVASDMSGQALFQVGAAVRDTVEINGFKDIRITGYNKNDSQAEREVFDNIHGTMTAIAGGDVDESTFAALETQIEEAITTVSTFRSYLGAQQNRIEYAISNIQAQSENLTEANSRIRDTDYAAETANLTKTQIMQQAATAMLAQANQMPNVILALLK